MKSKKKLFDLKLYQEGLRQLKTAGIISLIISLLCTVILQLVNICPQKHPIMSI